MDEDGDFTKLSGAVFIGIEIDGAPVGAAERCRPVLLRMGIEMPPNCWKRKCRLGWRYLLSLGKIATELG